MIRLVFPERRYLASYIDAFDEFQSQCVSTYGLTDARYIDVFQKFDRYRLAKDLPSDRVGADYYWLVDDATDSFLGEITIRHRLNAALELRGGHIGYAVRFSEWNKGYGTLMLKLALEQARSRGLTDILITCNDSNIASARIMEKNGLILQDKVTIKDDSEEVLVRRYRIHL